MKIVYFDQNKWIELTRAIKYPNEHPEYGSLIDYIFTEVENRRLIVPLTAANIYETYKINDPQRRHDLALTQSAISKGLVIRGRHSRLEKEITDVLCTSYGIPIKPRGPTWFLSNIFFEAFADLSDERIAPFLTKTIEEFARKSPADALYDYLMTESADVRSTIIRAYSNESKSLLQKIEQRRKNHSEEGMPSRSRIYSALLLIDEIDFIMHLAEQYGILPTHSSHFIAQSAKKLINDSPCHYIERELALRLESQNRPIEENDFRDMQNFCASVPYTDIIVAENQFINLSRQARLDKKYNTIITTNLLGFMDILKKMSAEGS